MTKPAWKLEPDREEFEHAGFPCLLNKNSVGAWCGYVALPPEHPQYGNFYDDVPVDVHGGLTYADHCHGSICHHPKKGAPDDVWWLGFDCAHYGDLLPEMFERFGSARPGEVYRDINFVRAETKRLAEQLKSLSSLAEVGQQ